MYLSLYCKDSKRVTQGLRVRGSWRPNRNCNILIPLLWPSTLCLYCSPNAGVHSAGCWLSLLHLISIFSGPQLIRATSPFGLVWLSLPHLASNSTATQLAWILSWLSYIIVQRPLDRPLDLWNRMFNRHQAEITVMQFRGHSLPVRQSMRVSWDFLACPILLANFRPPDFLSLTAIGMCHFLPVHHLEWHFGPGRRSKYNISTSK